MGRGLGRLAALISRAWRQLCVSVVHGETEVGSAPHRGDFPLLRSSSAACPNCSPSSAEQLGTLTSPIAAVLHVFSGQHAALTQPHL